MKTKTVEPGPEHQALMSDLKAVLKKHGDNLRADTILAICAQLTGQVLAMQDQRVMTPDAALAIVGANIEIGNAAAIQELMSSVNTRPI